jgi:integrase
MSELKEVPTKQKARKARRSGQIVTRANNKHLVRVFLGTDEATGKRRYHSKTIRGTKNDAQRYLNGVLRDLDLGTFVEPTGETLNVYLDHWLEAAAKPRLRERTFEDYKGRLKLYVREPLGDIKLGNLRPLDIQKLYSAMQDRGLSSRVVRYTNAILSTALKQAVRWGKLIRNPADLVQLPKLTHKEMRALSSFEAGQFLAATADHRLSSLFKIALATGMRPEEYLALQWKDVELAQGTVIVQRALILRKGGGWYFDEPKTASARRTIPLPISLVKELKEHRRNQYEERLRIGSEWQANDLVFCTEIGTPLNISNLTKIFKAALVKAKLPKTIRLYDLRHSCATLLLQAGENPMCAKLRVKPIENKRDVTAGSAGILARRTRRRRGSRPCRTASGQGCPRSRLSVHSLDHAITLVLFMTCRLNLAHMGRTLR